MNQECGFRKARGKERREVGTHVSDKRAESMCILQRATTRCRRIFWKKWLRRWIKTPTAAWPIAVWILLMNTGGRFPADSAGIIGSPRGFLEIGIKNIMCARAGMT